MTKPRKTAQAGASAELFEDGRGRLTVIALLGATGSNNILAQEDSSLEEEFEEASEKYRLPKELLLAIGYVNTH